MKRHSEFKDIIHVSESSIITLLNSILTGFIIPVVLGPLNYGYYRIFSLYSSYTTLGHFGFNDGILLQYAGHNLNKLDKNELRSNSLFLILFEMVISIIIMLFSFCTTNRFYKIIFILVGINCFFQNLLGYYQSISKATLKFGKYSLINVLQDLFVILSILIVLIIYKMTKIQNISFIIYSLIIIMSSAILVICYLYEYRSITFGRHKPFKLMLKCFRYYFISGCYLTIGYGISLLIFNLDSQFVIKFFSIKTYAIYGFAYSIFSAGLIILNSAAVVLLPHLKRASKAYILSKYSDNKTYVSLITCLSMVGYFPLQIIVKKFLYQYQGSLLYFKYLLPGIVLTCCVSIVISNYYYALGKVKFTFYLNLFILFVAFVIDTVAYILFKTPSALAISSTISLFIWYLLSDYFIVKWYKVLWIKNLFYIVVMIFVFCIFSSYGNILISSLLYMASYSCISYILFKNNIISLLTKCKDYLVNLIK